jgi:hypothetical protein
VPKNEGLQDLFESLDAAHDMLQGVDVLLNSNATTAQHRSARALLSLAVDMVAQSRELAMAMHV